MSNHKQFQISLNAVSWAGLNGLSFNAIEPNKLNQLSEGSNVSLNYSFNKPNPLTSFKIVSNNHDQKNSQGISFISKQKPSSFSNIQISSNYGNDNNNSHQGVSFIADKPK